MWLKVFQIYCITFLGVALYLSLRGCLHNWNSFLWPNTSGCPWITRDAWFKVPRAHLRWWLMSSTSLACIKLHQNSYILRWNIVMSSGVITAALHVDSRRSFTHCTSNCGITNDPHASRYCTEVEKSSHHGYYFDREGRYLFCSHSLSTLGVKWKMEGGGGKRNLCRDFKITSSNFACAPSVIPFFFVFQLPDPL